MLGDVGEPGTAETRGRDLPGGGHRTISPGANVTRLGDLSVVWSLVLDPLEHNEGVDPRRFIALRGYDPHEPAAGFASALFGRGGIAVVRAVEGLAFARALRGRGMGAARVGAAAAVRVGTGAAGVGLTTLRGREAPAGARMGVGATVHVDTGAAAATGAGRASTLWGRVVAAVGDPDGARFANALRGRAGEVDAATGAGRTREL